MVRFRFPGAPIRYLLHLHTCIRTMGFGNLASDAGLQALDNFLLDKSYIDG